MGDDRSEVAQPMHSLDVDRCPAPSSSDARTYAIHVTGRERCAPTVVDTDPVGRRREEFVPVDCGVRLHDGRPGAPVGGRFAGDIAGVELGEGGVEVVEVERDVRHDPLVGVDLRDAE